MENKEIKTQKLATNNNLTTYSVHDIEELIVTLRGVQVLIDRFPADFMFQLTKEEYNSLKCQNGTSNSSCLTATMTVS